MFANLPKIYIFDIDGTIANNEHRADLLVSNSLDRWDSFFKACVSDAPYKPIINILNLLYNSGSEIIFMTGRSDLVRKETIDWIVHHTELQRNYVESHLMMRIDGDFTQDQELKKNWFHALDASTRERVVCVYEDRVPVIEMWRSQGIMCVQVMPGNV